MYIEKNAKGHTLKCNWCSSLKSGNEGGKENIYFELFMFPYV